MSAVPQAEIRLERRRPGPDSRHVVSIADLRAFLVLLPDWDEVAVGLRAIVLDGGSTRVEGWYRPGIVALCAWIDTLWDVYPPAFFEDNGELLALLDVERVPVTESEESWGLIQEVGLIGSGIEKYIEVRWTEAQARAYQLLAVLPHELGHHHDWLTKRNARSGHRGEPYAEAYARATLPAVWPAYAQKFEI